MLALPRSAPKWSMKSLSATLLSSRAAFVCPSCRSLQYQQQSHLRSQRQRRGFSSSVALRENTKSGSSTAPPPPPSSGHARLTTRRLISISGADAPHFLQGLITTSIEGSNATNSNGTAPPTEQRPWYYCGFFNALGRVLHDVYIYPVPPGSGGEPHFMIEVDAAQLTTLLKHLKRFKLRSKIFLRAIEEDEMSVWQIWNDGEKAPSTKQGNDLARTDGRSIIIPDLRAPDMGYRVLTVGADLDVQALDLPSQLQSAAAGKTDEAAYRVRRYLRGVPEGSAEIISAQALPQESNMDVMGGIDFRKGCYVGQELTIRTRHRGVVRKRVLPCMLYGEDEAKPTTLEYKPNAAPSLGGGDLHGLTIGRHGKKGRSTGTFLAGTGNIGLALCRVQLMSDLVVPNDTATLEFDPAAEFVIQLSKEGEGEGEGGDAAGVVDAVKVKAFVPDWLRQRLDEDAVRHQR
ncbi:Aminomethyltransferase folate-binding domain-containing protein [Xylaria sp. FL1777]|nr:Aminomethyltransferase folate-binding domain-containing protein [Xylaria sp. FL1777]